MYEELKQFSDEDVKRTSQNFFKEKIKLHGVKSADVKKIAEKYFNLNKDKSKKMYLVYVRYSGNQNILRKHLLQPTGHIRYIKILNRKIFRYLKNG